MELIEHAAYFPTFQPPIIASDTSLGGQPIILGIQICTTQQGFIFLAQAPELGTVSMLNSGNWHNFRGATP